MSEINGIRLSMCPQGQYLRENNGRWVTVTREVKRIRLGMSPQDTQANSMFQLPHKNCVPLISSLDIYSR